jgi:DEAD/DEAH box helicase domain-containing protein
LPDASAMVERLRRLREQREANQPQQIAAPIRVASEPIEARFARGDQVFCVPYGQGEVRTSRVEGDKELLTVYFADHGELIIDPSVSAVRKLEENSDEIRENSDLD